MLSAIVAMAHRGVIGKKNELPWYLPADLKRFKQLTVGHTVIMGRNTAESIIARLGHGLPDRTNIVITHQADYQPEGFVVVHSLDEALRRAGEDTYIIGGQQIFTLAFHLLDRVYVTEVDADIDGDTYFPELKPNEWREVERKRHDKDEKNEYDYSYVTYERV